MKFTKMHGAGNDYVYVDGFRNALPADPPTLAVKVSDRHQGVGADGLILICPSDHADAEMRMFNADGSASEMCGNGIRCVAKYLFDHGIIPKSEMTIETGGGIKTLQLVQHGDATQVRVDMGRPGLMAADLPTRLPANQDGQVVEQRLEIAGRTFHGTCVSMGNPHCVVFVEPDDIVGGVASDELVLGAGPLLEVDERFPSRTNVEFVVVESPTVVRQRTWERGSGETLACGTGASAVCVAGVLTGRTQRKLTCHLTGGTLLLDWDESSGHVFMTGPAQEVFHGEYEWPTA